MTASRADASTASPSPVTAVELAPAKVNLCLHVTGRRPDGYHELDTLVAFADLGDTVRVDAAADGVFLRVSGEKVPDGQGLELPVVPPGTDNLVWRALATAAAARGGVPGLAVALDKRLPSGAGLGGGSSDAAAFLRGLDRVLGASPGRVDALGLGADLPMCLDPRPWRARGVGERLTAVALGRDLPTVLVWPGRALATPAVFAARSGAFGAPIPDAAVAALADDPVAALRSLRNDLTGPACRVEPAVAEALDAMEAIPGCRLARMSGSGSAVFGLFDDAPAAAHAAAVIGGRRPDWWARATTLRAGRVPTRLTGGQTSALPG